MQRATLTSLHTICNSIHHFTSVIICEHHNYVSLSVYLVLVFKFYSVPLCLRQVNTFLARTKSLTSTFTDKFYDVISQLPPIYDKSNQKK